MEFSCRDSREHGIVLIPRSSPEFPALVDEVQRNVRAAMPSAWEAHDVVLEKDDPLAAILLNQSDKSIVAFRAVWRFEEINGRKYGHYLSNLGPRSLLLPFGFDEKQRRLDLYWSTILPGSKRYFANRRVIGSNYDVRPPSPEEEWAGGGTGYGRASERQALSRDVKRVTLEMDCLFFADGEFLGSDDLRLFEEITYKAEMYQRVGRTAQQLADKVRASEVLSRVGELFPVGPATPFFHHRVPFNKPEDLRQQALSEVAHVVEGLRRSLSAEEAVWRLVAWATAPVPDYRRS